MEDNARKRANYSSSLLLYLSPSLLNGGEETRGEEGEGEESLALSLV